MSADDGATWVLADIVEAHVEPNGKAWAWSKFQVPIEARTQTVCAHTCASTSGWQPAAFAIAVLDRSVRHMA